MLGFLVGIVSVVGFYKVYKGHGRLGRWAQEGYEEWYDGPGYSPRRRWFVRRLAAKLDATPAQTKLLREAFEEVWGEARTAKAEWRRTRDDIMNALRSNEFDAELFSATFARQDAVIGDVRRVFVESVAKVHATLDAEQRHRLARHLARCGGPSDDDAGPYRVATSKV